MYDKIKSDIVSAMKEKDTLKLQTLRGVKGEIDLAHIDKKVEINDELVTDVLSHQIKTRKESIAEFEKGNREDLVNKTNDEINLLLSYLPEQLTEEELVKLIDEVIAKVNPTSQKEMGLIMKTISPKVKGRYNMKEISDIIKNKLSNL